ncbi:hypothetical protein B8000_21070 [Klebsiella pneumoniae]|nr:hypothetical protein B8Z90_05645 [Klebsiella pneumoniae]OVH13138.1 hypothetical protein B8000_21070 [Klebsiella pneumoniae]
MLAIRLHRWHLLDILLGGCGNSVTQLTMGDFCAAMVTSRAEITQFKGWSADFMWLLTFTKARGH